ncbi:right-handed parallel beta-helix repeat-containing protein [Streptomyces sp. NRRL S-337]|uniref:right-handed parallel beta-helix repeat-containing protein n=1 Tax=Streptomyces sp. NRRL S-337 TaxID=1463900 RepID=UPI00099CE61B|nr:right-handed parallel beta-helix repeat-containing protein [Streptomyces sp. NRRL S-337]
MQIPSELRTDPPPRSLPPRRSSGARVRVFGGTGAVLLSASSLVPLAAPAVAGPLAGPGPAATARVVEVSTAGELKDALAAARPGDTIRLADGTYRGNFRTTAAGTSASHITLTGSPRAVLTASGGYGLYVNGASYWTVKGITVTGGQKGIVMDAASGVVIDSVTVRDLAMEGVHFRNSSKNGVIKNSTIRDTGKNGSGMGEGVYVGSAGGTDDKSDNVQILGNTIGPGVGGENIDIKEGTTGAKISGNTFDGSGLTGAHFDDSWVDIKGNKVLVENNTGRHTSNNGYETHSQQPGWGCGTVFRGNRSDLSGATGSGRYGFNITNYDASGCPVTIAGDNTVTGGRGVTNPGVPVG